MYNQCPDVTIIPVQRHDIGSDARDAGRLERSVAKVGLPTDTDHSRLVGKALRLPVWIGKADLSQPSHPPRWMKRSQRVAEELGLAPDTRLILSQNRQHLREILDGVGADGNPIFPLPV